LRRGGTDRLAVGIDERPTSAWRSRSPRWSSSPSTAARSSISTCCGLTASSSASPPTRTMRRPSSRRWPSPTAAPSSCRARLRRRSTS